MLAETLDGRRVYPLGAQLAQSVGYARDGTAVAASKTAFDHALRFPPASTAIRWRRWVQSLVAAFQGAPVASRSTNVVTTIVPSVQNVLYNELSRYHRAAGVVLDPRSS